MFVLKTNEPIKVINLQKLANQSMLYGALVIEIFSNSFSESIATRKKNSLETRAVFKEFSEYVNNSGVVVY